MRQSLCFSIGYPFLGTVVYWFVVLLCEPTSGCRRSPPGRPARNRAPARPRASAGRACGSADRRGVPGGRPPDAEGVERQPIDRAVRVGNRPDAADEKAPKIEPDEAVAKAADAEEGRNEAPSVGKTGGVARGAHANRQRQPGPRRAPQESSWASTTSGGCSGGGSNGGGDRRRVDGAPGRRLEALAHCRRGAAASAGGATIDGAFAGRTRRPGGCWAPAAGHERQRCQRERQPNQTRMRGAGPSADF